MRISSDTIAVNDSILDAFKQSRNYDYASDLLTDDNVNYFDHLMRKLEDWLNFSMPAEDIPSWFWWSLAAMALMGVFWLIWKNKERLFGTRDVEFDVQQITEDDINEVDFDHLIDEAQKNGDYLTLCRLRYLQTLKAASDASLVKWRLYKTPSQYATEWRDDDFGSMTNHFLRIRYGRYTADAALAEEMRSLQATLMSRINSIAGAELPAKKQEGGEQA